MQHSSTLVIGHRNPDTDAICSAIGHASYLRRVKSVEQAEAACCGLINSRTEWVLKQADMPAPQRVMDVRPTAGGVCRKDVCQAQSGESFLDVYQRMLDRNVRVIPVVDEKNHPVGLVSMLGLLGLVLPDASQGGDQVRNVRTSLSSIVRTLRGTVAIDGGRMDGEEDLIMTVAGSSADVFADRTSQFPANQLIVIVGDRPPIHEIAIERGVRALVLTGGFSLGTEALVTLAKQRGIAVISAPKDTASTLQLIRCSRAVESAVDHNFRSFKATDPIDHVRAVAAELSQVLFPVVDPDDDTLVGVFSKSDLLDPPRQRLVLVDHNEFSQAVDGADQAEILEVIDHHRLSGNLVSKEPIRFINEPVGSTCTIVARAFQQAGVDPDKGVATCLAAGITADTLKLSSPTATPTDVEILSWLCGLAEIDLDEFAQGFFEVGSVLNECTPDESVGTDRKDYQEGGRKISISQIEELGLEVFWKQKDDLEASLQKLVDKDGYDFACLMVTDITKNDSLLLTAGDEMIDEEINYPELDSGLFELRGVVSRKKQLFPVLSRILEKMAN